MAIDNSLYDSLENTHVKITEYFQNNQLGREHSTMIIKHEELSELLETLDIEAIEEQSTDIHALHAQLNEIKEISNKVGEVLGASFDSVATADKVVLGLDEVFFKIGNVRSSVSM